MPVCKKWLGGSSRVRFSLVDDTDESSSSAGNSKVQVMETGKRAVMTASNNSQSLPDIAQRHSARIRRSSSVILDGGTKEESKRGGEIVCRRKGPTKSVTLDETQFHTRRSLALTPSARCGITREARSFSGPQPPSGIRAKSDSSLESPHPYGKATGLRSRATSGCVSSTVKRDESFGGDLSARTQLKAVEERLLEVEGLLADESSVLKEYVARCNTLQAENAALKTELQNSKEAVTALEEEALQVANELKEVKVTLASAKYETSVTRKVQDDMMKKLSEARAEGRKAQTEADLLRDKLHRMEAFWGPLEAKTAECLRSQVILNIEDTLKQYQTMPYRECATMIDVLRNKYHPGNHANLPALHRWFFAPILQVIEEKGRVALLRSQSIIPEGQRDEIAMEKRNQVKQRIHRSNRLLGLVDS